MNLSDLNPSQLEAVQTTGGPILIFAGAGSGKTRVLTHKIAYLIQNIGLPPENILAVTFTNKAAQEMNERVMSLVKVNTAKMSIGTFHSICAGILRKNIHHLGYTNSFTIYDSSDSKTLVKNVIKDMNLDSKQFEASSYQYMISSKKNSLLSPNDVAESAEGYESLNEPACQACQHKKWALSRINPTDQEWRCQACREARSRPDNGTLHMQSRGLNGRKFFAWGREPSSQNRYYYLSSCEPPAGKCHGEYFEMCAWK